MFWLVVYLFEKEDIPIAEYPLLLLLSMLLLII